MTIAICVALAGALGYERHYAYRHVLARVEVDLAAKANVLAEHMARTLEIATQMQLSTRQARREAEAKQFDKAATHELLKTVHARSPIFRSIIWTNADGDVVASSHFADAPRVNISEHEDFQIPKNDPAYADRPFIGRPFNSTILDRWIIPVTLRQTDAEGAFIGVAAGVIEPAYLSSIYGRALLGEAGSAYLARDDGAVLTREPFDDAVLGQTLPTSVADRLGAAEGATDNFVTDALDGKTRLVAAAPVADHGVTVIVSLTKAEALGEFYRETAVGGGLLGVAILALLAAGLYVGGQVRQREALQAKLRANYSRTREYAAISSDWFWQADADLRCTWVSETANAANGLPADWREGAPLTTVFDSDDGAFRAAIERRTAFRDIEVLRQTESGNLWLAVSALPIVDDSGRFQGYRGAVRDVTDLWRAEQRLQDALTAVPGGFTIFDAEERLQYVNPSPVAMTRHFATEQDLGDTFENILRRSPAMENIRAAGGDSEAFIAERLSQFRNPKGESLVEVGKRVIEVLERPTQDGGVVALRFDVTARERALEAERTARAEADRANQAKSDFLANMSHELRTPLNVILGFGQMLQIDNEARLSPTQREYADHVVTAGQHLLNLVTEMLDMASVETGRVKLAVGPTDIAEIVRHVTAAMAPVAARQGVRIFESADFDIEEVEVDVQRLRQVLLNLMSNAIKYNHAGGEVVVSTEARDNVVRIAVTDTGVGIPADRRDEVFKPFSRLGAEANAIDGAGIGLALSKRLVEAMDGRIGFESEYGIGSTFWIELKRMSPSPTERPANFVAAHASTQTAAAGGLNAC